MFIFLNGVVFSFFSFFFFRKKFLINLLSIEFLMLSMFMYLFYLFHFVGMEMSMCFFFLIMVVCEASLGLSLLINLTRYKGNDMLSSLNSFKC